MRRDSDFNDDGLKEVFQQLKQQERLEVIPSFEEILDEKTSSPFAIWKYAVGLVAVLSSIVFWVVNTDEPGENSQSMQIILSYEELEEESEEFRLGGMDQWQSETDILLTGL